MATEFDSEQALARWRALEEEKWRGLDIYRASLKADDIPAQERLLLIKDWLTRVREAQTEERARLLKQLRAAKLTLQKTADDWRLVPIPPQELHRDAAGDEDDEDDEDNDAQHTDVPAFDHPLLHLGMGLITSCTMIVAKSALPSWLARGWIELPYRRCPFQDPPRRSETIIAGRPYTLVERGASSLVGVRVEGYHPTLLTFA